MQITQLRSEVASLKKAIEDKDSDNYVRDYRRYYNDYYYDRNYLYRDHYYDRYHHDDEWDLTVYVEDEDGDGIDDARVHIEDGDEKTRHTNSDGKVRFYDLEDDCYDIEVDADGYDDYDDDFCLHRDRTITIELRD